MRLQIKKLEGPGEILLNTGTETSYDVVSTTNTSDNRFTCYFNRAINATDTFPIRVHIYIYNNEGTLQNNREAINLDIISLDNVNDADTDNANVCFRVNLNCPETFSGSYFHIHAILTNLGANNVSYDVSSYHETIKKVYIYSDKEFLQVYWSSSEQITHEEATATQDSLRTGDIYQDEDAFLHIKTRGMYKDNIVVVLTAGNDTVILRSAPLRMNQNRRVVAFSIADTIQRYRQQAGEGNFTLKAWVAAYDTDNRSRVVVLPRAYERLEINQLPASNANILVRTEASNMLPIQEINTIAPLFLKETSGELTVTCSDAEESPVKRSSTGTVYVRVATIGIEQVTPTRFRDFKIGCVVHIEGIGRSRARDNNAQQGTFYTVYPINVYELMLSDLVACGLVTIAEAVYLTTVGHQGVSLEERTDLENSFDKLTASLSSTKNLIHVFQDRGNATVAHRNRISKSAARKVLAQVRHKPSLWIEPDGQEMCRDAWQLISGRYRSNGLKEVYPRNQNGQYNTYKECPPGEYFLNWLTGGTYNLFVAEEPTGSNIYTYPRRQIGDANRSEIAFHRGGAKASIGCITFNVPYSVRGGDNGNYNLFNGIVFEEKNRTQSNTHWLNILCMDERNAAQSQDDTNTVYRDPDRRTHANRYPVTQNFWRWYDLTTPR